MRSLRRTYGSLILQHFLHFCVARSLPHRVCAIGKGLAQAEAEDFLCTGLWISSSAIRRAYVRDVGAIRQQNPEGLAFALLLTLRRAVTRFTGVLPLPLSCAYTSFAIAPIPSARAQHHPSPCPHQPLLPPIGAPADLPHTLRTLPSPHTKARRNRSLRFRRASCVSRLFVPVL